MRKPNPAGFWIVIARFLVLQEFARLESQESFSEAFTVSIVSAPIQLRSRTCTFQENKEIYQYNRKNCSDKLHLSSSRDGNNSDNEKYNYKKGLLNQWGVYYSTGGGADSHSKEPIFPYTFASVSKAACDAITSTIYQKSRPDPNVASNAMSQSVFHYRPVRNTKRDAGRIGIEIDGARFLMNGSDNTSEENSGVKDQEEMALTRLALLMAMNLSERPWKDLENTKQSKTEISKAPKSSKSKNQDHDIEYRPVAVFFSSLRLALVASRELQYLKEQYRVYSLSKNRKSSSYKQNHHLFYHAAFHSYEPSSSFPFDNIKIRCLGQDDIPVEMLKPSTKGTKFKSIRRDGYVDPTKGLLLIVQPSSTFGTTSFLPVTQHTSGRSADTISTIPPIESLQKLITRSTLYQIPTILLSPRLGDKMPSTPSSSYNIPAYRGRPHYVTANRRGGLDSSNYQHSETYGGSEPARPSPWLLRDYSPPVFAWIATSCLVSNRNNHHNHQSRENPRTTRNTNYLEKIGLLHSVIDIGHAWHLFTRNRNNESDVGVGPKYRYMASTKPSSGRPSMGIIEAILRNYNQDEIEIKHDNKN